MARLVALVNEQEAGPLSQQERTVVILLCEGLTNGEIAPRVGLTEAAVTLRLTGVLKRLGLRNRVQLAVWAVLNGLYPPRG